MLVNGLLLLLQFCFMTYGYPKQNQEQLQLKLENLLNEEPKIAIITAQTMGHLNQTEYLHNSPDYAELFIQNKKEWARFQGYDYVHTVIEADPSTRDLPEDMVDQSIHYLKIDLMETYLPQYDWIVWLDMDTIVVDHTVMIEEFVKQATRTRSQVDLIMEGSEDYKAMNGDALKSGVMIMRNSFWTRRLLAQLKEVLAQDEWMPIIKQAMTRNSTSFLDEAFVFLLNSDHHADPHLYLMHLQDRWNQKFVYLPKIGILHFSGCTINNAQCIDMFHRAVNHLLRKEQLYVYIIAPYVQHIYNIFAGIYVLFALDRLFHIIGRYFGSRTKNRLKKAILPDFHQVLHYPCVVVQLPMFNESSCCQTIIDAACQLEWPLSRLYVQVVDDSTSEETKNLINVRVAYWKARGVNVCVERRPHRQGFKAGAMNEAMEHFPSDAEYIAIFDADFLPQQSFLKQTVPYLIANKSVGFVQTCWIYTNAKESLLTRMQEISLNFHFKCEQEMRFKTKKFFNFNGTAGVWRKEAIDQSGGWHTDTLVEDMDLSLRAFSNGWEFIYLSDVKVLNEIPPTFSAYRGQQHRWTSGPMQVLKKAFRTVYESKKLSVLDKLFCLWFFLRNYVHIINFLYFLVLIPLMIFVPRVSLYEWAVVYLPAAISMSNVIFTPSEIFSVVHYVLFENAMCLYKTGALICGVLNIGKAKQWIVTPKYARKVLTPDEETVELEDLEACKHSPVQSHDSYSSDSGCSSLSRASTPEGIHSSGAQSFASLPSLRYSDSGDLDEHSGLLIPAQEERPKQRIIPLARAYELSKWLKPKITFHYQELAMALFLACCAYFGFLMRQNGIATFSLLNSAAYFVLGLGYIGRSG